MERGGWPIGFPRSTERGPIEADRGARQREAGFAFRVQQNAAPLKPHDDLAALAHHALSAFNRTRPH